MPSTARANNFTSPMLLIASASVGFSTATHRKFFACIRKIALELTTLVDQRFDARVHFGNGCFERCRDIAKRARFVREDDVARRPP